MNNFRNSNSELLPAPYPAFLEVTEDGVWTGHVLELPGCVSFGAFREDAVERLRIEIVDWHEWLLRHGEAVTVPHVPPLVEVLEVVERVSVSRKSGEAVALFTPDLDPATEEGIGRALTLLRYCQDDISDLVADRPASVQNARVAHGHRSVIEIVRHIGQAECWYLTRLESGDPEDIAALYQRVTTGEPLDGLAEVLSVAQQRFHGWTEAQRTQRFVPQHNSRYGTEPWTARKVLRRFVEHRREHIDEINRTIQQMSD